MMPVKQTRRLDSRQARGVIQVPFYVAPNRLSLAVDRQLASIACGADSIPLGAGYWSGVIESTNLSKALFDLDETTIRSLG